MPPALSSRRASCGCVCRAALVRWALSARGVSAGGTGRLMVTSHSGCRELLRVTRALWAQSYKSVGTESFPRMRNCADAHRQALGISNTERVKCARAHNNPSAKPYIIIPDIFAKGIIKIKTSKSLIGVIVSIQLHLNKFECCGKVHLFQ